MIGVGEDRRKTVGNGRTKAKTKEGKFNSRSIGVEAWPVRVSQISQYNWSLR